MNLKFLKSINESLSNSMTPEELNTYMNIMHKKCNKSTRVEFEAQLRESLGLDEIDLQECSRLIIESGDSKIIKQLEIISNKPDPNSLNSILDEG